MKSRRPKQYREENSIPRSPHRLSHIDQDGAARMIDIGHKTATKRKAIAEATIEMQPETLHQLLNQSLPKGDALQIARVAGILAAKRTAESIPLCHPIPLTRIDIDFFPHTEQQLRVLAEVENTAQTGVEMEALHACTIAALTIYDMAKSIDPCMEVNGLHVKEKSGGKRGEWSNPTKTKES